MISKYLLDWLFDYVDTDLPTYGKSMYETIIKKELDDLIILRGSYGK